MNIANAKILVCPYCKGEKPVIQLLSGNTFGGSQWSDLKTEYPMLKQPSPVQLCPNCGKFYFTATAESHQADYYSFEQGNLSYEQAADALKQFNLSALEKDQEIILRLLFVHTFNDKYQREFVSKGDLPSEEEKAEFKKQVLRLLEIWETEPLVKAELYREIGDFEQCLSILSTLQPDEPLKQKIASQIRQFAIEKKCTVFLLYGNRTDFEKGGE